MLAIVLSFDKYRSLTEHMVFKYHLLWQDHPFKFRIPYQELNAETYPLSNRVEFIKTPKEIKPTVLELIRDLDDEEWVYWCIDDKYPVSLNISKINSILNWIKSDESQNVSGILFCRWHKMLQDEFLSGEIILDPFGNSYLERNGYEQIWIHQFLRVKVLRYLFEAFPDDIPFAKVMDNLKTQVTLPKEHKIFVSKNNWAVFGESTSHGVLTRNCHASLIQNELTLPDWFTHTTEKEIFLGKVNVNTSLSRKFLTKVKTYLSHFLKY